MNKFCHSCEQKRAVTPPVGKRNRFIDGKWTCWRCAGEAENKESKPLTAKKEIVQTKDPLSE